MFLQGKSGLHLRQMGRWAAEQTMQIYIQEAMGTFCLNQIPKKSIEEFALKAQTFARTLCAPPTKLVAQT